MLHIQSQGRNQLATHSKSGADERAKGVRKSAEAGAPLSEPDTLTVHLHTRLHDYACDVPSSLGFKPLAVPTSNKHPEPVG